MLKSVLTTALPPAGTTLGSAAERSKPADWGEPRVGMTALGLRNFTCRTLELDILRAWMGRIIMLVVQQASSAEWRRRRTRGGMVKERQRWRQCYFGVFETDRSFFWLGS